MPEGTALAIYRPTRRASVIRAGTPLLANDNLAVQCGALAPGAGVSAFDVTRREDAPEVASSLAMLEEIVVRCACSTLVLAQALKRALKRESALIVDYSVTAEDIAALPDRSITETLQRIPGVAIDRFAAVATRITSLSSARVSMCAD